MDVWIAYIYGCVITYGLLIGSFLNVVIFRWPAERSIVVPRSSCGACHATIPWHDNIPVLSWLALGARCRYCRTSISWRYPGVEVLTGVLAGLTLHRFVPDVYSATLGQGVAFVFYFAFVASLVAITFIDLDHKLIPNAITLWGMPIGVVGVVLLDRLNGGFVTPASSVLGVVIGAGSLAGIRALYYLVRRQEGMGLGDVKMLGMMGAFLGHHPALIFIMFVSSFVGSVVGVSMMVLFRRNLKYEVPFGPFLALGGLVYLLWGYEWTSWLGPLMGMESPRGMW